MENNSCPEAVHCEESILENRSVLVSFDGQIGYLVYSVPWLDEHIPENLFPGKTVPYELIQNHLLWLLSNICLKFTVSMNKHKKGHEHSENRLV